MCFIFLFTVLFIIAIGAAVVNSEKMHGTQNIKYPTLSSGIIKLVN
jgi:hypothetical protein